MYLQQNKKFDWLLTVDPIWLVWNTDISHSLTHSSTDPSITYPMRWLGGIFLQKKINSIKELIQEDQTLTEPFQADCMQCNRTD